MKTKMMVLLAVLLCLALMCCACGAPEGDEPGEEVNGEEEPVEGENGEGGESEEPAGMARINIFETGILGQDPQDVESKDDTVAAYSVSDYIENNFAGAPVDPVVLVASDGYAVSTQVEEFIKHFITMEGESAPLMVGPEVSGELSVKFLLYIKTANESICFVEDTLNVGEIFETLEMIEAENYRFVASDGFSFDVAAADIGECTLYKSEESVNATLPGLSGGDLRDVLYIEAVQ